MKFTRKVYLKKVTTQELEIAITNDELDSDIMADKAWEEFNGVKPSSKVEYTTIVHKTLLDK